MDYRIPMIEPPTCVQSPGELLCPKDILDTQGRHHDGLLYIHTGKGMLVSASVVQRINRAVENHFNRARGVTLAAVAALTVAALVPTSVWNANVVGGTFPHRFERGGELDGPRSGEPRRR